MARSWLERKAIKYLTKRGYTVKHERPDMLDDLLTPQHLREFEIATMIDVGVLTGSPIFYNAFPKAKLVLIDPQPNIAELVAPWISKRGKDIILINAGAGSEESTATLNISGGASSFLERTEGKHQTVATATARIAPLDVLIEEAKVSGPFGLKIDSEGYEMKVIEGATETLKACAFVFAEISISPRFKDGYVAFDFIAEMDRRGFKLARVVQHPKTVRFFDGLFIPK